MGLSTILNTTTSALQAVQTQMQWRSDNISSAQNPTYGRRDAVTNSLGTHTVVAAVSRAVDNSLQDQFLTANSISSASAATQDYFNRLGDIMGTSQSTPYLQQAIDDFSGAWKAYETDPSSATSETQIINTGMALANHINESALQFNKVESNIRDEIGTQITSLNSKLSDLDKINKQLNAEPLADTVDPGLYDKRDSLVRDISSMISVVRIGRTDGSVALYTKNGTALIDHGATQFQWNNTAGGVPWISLAPPASTGTYPGLNAGFPGGTLGAALDFLNPSASSTNANVGALAKARAQLDDLATQLAGNAMPSATLPTAITAGSSNVAVKSSVGLTVGMLVTGTNIPANTTIASLNADNMTIGLQTTNAATGVTAPTVFANNAVDATVTYTYAIQPNSTVTPGSKTVTVAGITNDLSVGMAVSWADVPAGTTIATIGTPDPVTNTTTITLNNAVKNPATQPTANVGIIYSTPRPNTFGGAYYNAPSDRTTDLIGGNTNSLGQPNENYWGQPPAIATQPLAANYRPPANWDATPLNSFFVIDNGSLNGSIAPTLSASQSFAVNASLIDHTATVKRQSASAVIASLTATQRTMSNGGVSTMNRTYAGLAASVADYQTNSQSAAGTDSTRETATTHNLDTRLASAIGVNMDTEMAQLTILQNAYTANARVINTVQTMFDTLLNITK
ncbi:MAG: flagellar basal body rod C-terminal domain-containing protein [Rhodospirillaceae bacterium]